MSGVALAKRKKANWRLKQVKAVAPQPKADRSARATVTNRPKASLLGVRNGREVQRRPGEN